MLTYICDWLGYTLGSNNDIDKIVYTAACVMIIIFGITIISLINRLLNALFIGFKKNG